MSDQDNPDTPRMTDHPEVVRCHCPLCPDPYSVTGHADSPRTADQLLYDLDDRIDRAVKELKEMRGQSINTAERARYLYKIEGLLLVRDWLRSYQ